MLENMLVELNKKREIVLRELRTFWAIWCNRDFYIKISNTKIKISCTLHISKMKI